MGLDAIVEEVKARGKAEAERISGETYLEVSKIVAEAKSHAAKIKAEKQEAVKKEIETLRQQELAGGHLEVKRALLNSRKEVLDEVYEKSKESLIKLSPDKNQKILKTILENAGGTSARIYSNAKDKELVKKFTKLKYAGEIECIGGIILENESGTESLDFRYEMILKNVSEQSLKQVSDILFG